VRDEDDGVGVAAQEGLEPVARLEVEVVGGLVEEQELRLLQQQGGQGDAHLPAAGELAAVAVEVGGLEAEARQHRLGAALHVVAAVGVPRLARRGVRGHQGVVLGIVGGAVRQPVLQAAALGGDLARVVERRHRLRPHTAAAQAHDLLRQVADVRALGHADDTAVGLHLAGDDAQEGRLPRAVGAHQRHAPAERDEPVDLVEDDLAAEGFMKAGDGEHGDFSSGAGMWPQAGRGRSLASSGRVFYPEADLARKGRSCTSLPSAT